MHYRIRNEFTPRTLIITSITTTKETEDISGWMKKKNDIIQQLISFRKLQLILGIFIIHKFRLMRNITMHQMTGVISLLMMKDISFTLIRRLMTKRQLSRTKVMPRRPKVDVSTIRKEITTTLQVNLDVKRIYPKANTIKQLQQVQNIMLSQEVIELITNHQTEDIFT